MAQKEREDMKQKLERIWKNYPCQDPIKTASWTTHKVDFTLNYKGYWRIWTSKIIGDKEHERNSRGGSINR